MNPVPNRLPVADARPDLETLLENPRLWRGRGEGRSWRTVPSGHARLDGALPGGGWPAGMLTEIAVERYGSGEMALFMPLLARLSGEGGGDARRGWMVWVAPPYLPYAPALAAAGVDPARTLVVRAGSDADALWAAEQALLSGTCAIVLAWVARAGGRPLRRLQLAAERSGTPIVLFRPVRALESPSPAALRLKLASGHDGVRLHLVKHRGGAPVVLPFETLLSS